MIGRTVSHFRITESLGRGGMGVVYLGEDMDLGRPVALKFLPPHLSSDSTAKKRFIQEAKAASSLNHRHICTIYEIGQTEPTPGKPGDEQLFIAMAYYAARPHAPGTEIPQLPGIKSPVLSGARVARVRSWE